MTRSLDYASITEKAWQEQILAVLDLHGWQAYHTYDSRRSQPGWPDIVALHPKGGDIIAVELKAEKGKATPTQLQWLAWFEAADVDSYLWRPSDVDEAIARIAAPQHRVRRG